MRQKEAGEDTSDLLKTLRRISVGRWQYPLAPPGPVVLLYHGVSALDSVVDMNVSTFKAQMRFLAKRYRVIDWREEVSRKPFDAPSVVLTFDDGFRNNLDVAAPVLQSLGLPAIFFVCTRHAEPGRTLWFRQLELIEHLFPGKCLHFDGRVFDLSSGKRARSMADLREVLLSLRPHPQALYEALEQLPSPDSFLSPAQQADRCEGLQTADIAELASEGVFTIGVHSQDHPFLTYCTPEEREQQLVSNQHLLRAASGQACDIGAYPSGDYNPDVIKLARRIGLEAAFAVDARFGGDKCYQIPRFGIYRGSIADLATKIQWGTAMRRFGPTIG